MTWRADYGAPTAEELMALLRPDGEAPDVGVEIPEDATTIEIHGVVIPESLREEAEAEVRTNRNHRVLIRAIDAGSRVWTMIAETDLTDTEWNTVTIDLTKGKNTEYFQPPEPPLTIASIWVERSEVAAGLVVDGDTLLISSFEAVGPTGRTPLDLSEMTPTNQLTLVREADADGAARARYASVPVGETRPTEDELRASPLWKDGTAMSWTVPPQRTRANTAVPQLWRIPPDLNVLLDREAASIAGLNPGSVSSYAIGSQIINGEVVGFIELVPTTTDTRLRGVMVIDLDAYNAWANGNASWSLSGVVSRVEGPRELWASTDEPDGTVRVVSAQMPDAPDEVWTIGGAQAAFSSRPVQVGLVAILFVGAITGVVLALAGVTGYVLLAVSRRAREMGVLRALGFERTSVAVTFALEQFVVIGIGAAIGVLGGIVLVIVMLPFFQLGESAVEIVPSILLTVPGPQLFAYIAVVGLLLIASVLWATRRVSTRKMSEVLREVER